MIMAESKFVKEWGSDEIPDLFCEVCLKEGKKSEAIAFCIECGDYFCKVCLKYHTTFLKDHSTLDDDNMPKDVERCQLHREIIKLYCETCKNFACNTCKANHSSSASDKKTCKLTPVLELSKDIERSQELRTFRTDMETIISKLANIKQNEPNLENVAAQAKQEVHKFKVKILAKAEHMEGEIEKKKQTDADILLTLKARSNAIESTMNDVSNKIKQGHTNVRSRQCATFIFMKRMQPQMESIDQELDEINTKMAKMNYQFEPNESIKCFLEAKETFGTLKSEMQGRVVMKIKKRKVAILQTDFPDCSTEMTAINFCVLPGQWMAICYACPDSLLLFNMSDQCYSSITQLGFNTTPSAITYIEERQFAVALEGHQNKTGSTITFIAWSKENSLHCKGKSFKVGLECKEIIYNTNRLIMLLLHPEYDKCKLSQLIISDMNGVVMETFDTGPDHLTPGVRFSNNSWLALDKKVNKLYATHFQLNRLTVIDLGKEHKGRNITHQLLFEPFEPEGVAVDEHGCIYAGLDEQNKIIYLNPVTGESQDVLTEEDGIYKPLILSEHLSPRTLRYCEKDSLLYVQSIYGHQVFKIKEI